MADADVNEDLLDYEEEETAEQVKHKFCISPLLFASLDNFVS